MSKRSYRASFLSSGMAGGLSDLYGLPDARCAPIGPPTSRSRLTTPIAPSVSLQRLHYHVHGLALKTTTCPIVNRRTIKPIREASLYFSQSPSTPPPR